MKKIINLTTILLFMAITANAIKPTGSKWRCVLPASQFTPEQTWTAQVMIFNDGQNYSDPYYNQVIGEPPADGQGRAWYATDYELTDGSQSWKELSSPFSSDESYKNKKSTQWATSGIMADIYLRRTFTVTQGFGGDVWLSCGHDDAPAEWYINGVLVHTVSDGWNNDEIIMLTTAQKALIKTDGTENIIAVHVHQNWGGAYADCGLYEDLTKNTSPILNTVANGGKWGCFFLELSDNEELESLDTRLWTGRCANEELWQWGNGPFSSENDYFLSLPWASGVHPLIVRRHFTLTKEDMDNVLRNNYELTISYDENPKVYLNGTLIWQQTGWNDGNYASYQFSRPNKNLLREGDNILAVSLTSGGGSGHLDYGLNISTPYQEPSAVNELTAKENRETTSIYNLQGQQLTSPQKGINIINGKKVIR